MSGLCNTEILECHFFLKINISSKLFCFAFVLFLSSVYLLLEDKPFKAIFFCYSLKLHTVNTDTT